MKKFIYLFLLVPTLLLTTACNKNPVAPETPEGEATSESTESVTENKEETADQKKAREAAEENARRIAKQKELDKNKSDNMKLAKRGTSYYANPSDSTYNFSDNKNRAKMYLNPSGKLSDIQKLGDLGLRNGVTVYMFKNRSAMSLEQFGAAANAILWSAANDYHNPAETSKEKVLQSCYNLHIITLLGESYISRIWNEYDKKEGIYRPIKAAGSEYRDLKEHVRQLKDLLDNNSLVPFIYIDVVKQNKAKVAKIAEESLSTDLSDPTINIMDGLYIKN